MEPSGGSQEQLSDFYAVKWQVDVFSNSLYSWEKDKGRKVQQDRS